MGYGKIHFPSERVLREQSSVQYKKNERLKLSTLGGTALPDSILLLKEESAMACSHCGKDGHNISTCPDVRRCSLCGKPGHNRRTCEASSIRESPTDTKRPPEKARAGNKAEVPAGYELLPATLVRVHDGDTIVVRVHQKYGLGTNDVWVRIRGVDAPESSEHNDKFEREYDRFSGTKKAMLKLGRLATEQLEKLLDSKEISLICQPVNDGGKPYLHHRQFRLLAYVLGKDGTDAGKMMIEQGFALVWPRRIPKPLYYHPKTNEYIESCNSARNACTGLWSKGLDELCPLAGQKGKVSVNLCRENCDPSAGRNR